jgi:hypothetical protein
MKSAEFETLLDAAIYRANHGGWLFVNSFSEALWFSAEYYTPSAIMLKTRGNGELVCDNRYLPKTCRVAN